MMHFTSWTRSSRREESNPSSTPISKGTKFSLFKSIPFRRRTQENDEVTTSGKAKNLRTNPPNRPKAKLFSLFSRSPVGPSSNPPPVPPKDVQPSSPPFSSTNRVAEYRNSPANLGDRSTPYPKVSDRHHAGRRNLPQEQQTQPEIKANISQQILVPTQPFRNVEPIITYDNRVRATVVHRRQNAQTISPTDVALARAKGPIPVKNTPIGMHALVKDEKNDTSTKHSVLLSQSDCLQPADPFPSEKPTALKTDDWSSNLKSLSTHSTNFSRERPVVAFSLYDTATPINGAREHGPIASELPPQDDDTPRLDTGLSVVSFVDLRSRWSLSTSNDGEEEASGSDQLPVAATEGDEEAVSSRSEHAETIGDQQAISHRPNNSIATSTESDRTIRPRQPMNAAVGSQTPRRVGPPPRRAPPPLPSSKHKEVERKESQRVQPTSQDSSGSSGEQAEGQATRNPRYSAHYRSPGVAVDVSSGRPFNVAETEEQLRFYAMVGSRQLYHATAMSARAYGYVVGPDHALRRTPVSNNAGESSTR